VAREGVVVHAVGRGARKRVELGRALAHALRVRVVHLVVDEAASRHVPARVEVRAVAERDVRVGLDDAPEVDVAARHPRPVQPRAVLLGAVPAKLLQLGSARRPEAVRLARLPRRRLVKQLEQLVRLLLPLLLLGRLCPHQIHHCRQLAIVRGRRRPLPPTLVPAARGARRGASGRAAEQPVLEGREGGGVEERQLALLDPHRGGHQVLELEERARHVARANLVPRQLRMTLDSEREQCRRARRQCERRTAHYEEVEQPALQLGMRIGRRRDRATRRQRRPRRLRQMRRDWQRPVR